MKQMLRNTQLRAIFLLLFFIPLLASATGHTVTISSNISVLCFGGNTGSASAAVSGGTGPFGYQWSPSGGTQATANNLAAGQYTVTVTDLSDNSTASATVTITQPTQLLALPTSTPTACGNCTGTVSPGGSGGTGPYNYSWSPNWNTTNLCQGTYTLAVTDMNGCYAIATTVVGLNSTLAVSISGTPSGCQSCSGTATASVTGGTPPYTYAWTNSQTTATANNLCANSVHSCTVTDAIGCSLVQSYTVGNSSGFSLGSTATNITCNNNGSISISTNGGVPPFSYAWTHGPTTQTVSNLSAGVYHVTVTDATGCTASISDTVNIDPNALLGSISLTPAVCNSASGTGQAYASGGTAPYYFLWSNAMVGQSVSGLTPGNYSCTISDGAGCVITTQQLFLYTTNPMNMSVSGVSASCNLNDGAATTILSGATPPVMYSWSNSSTSASQTNLSPGVYSVTVTDALGCSLTDTAEVHSGCDNLISGTVYFDQNNNCVYDGTDQYSYGYVTANPGNYTASINNTGQYTLRIPVTGTFTVSENVYGYSPICPSSGTYTQTFATLNNISNNNDFALHVDTIRDLYVSLSSDVARPGFLMNYYVFYRNMGSIAIPNVTLTMNHDAILTYVSSSTAPSSYTAPQLPWNLGTLAPGQMATITVTMLVPTIQNGGCIGCVLNSSAQINPVAGDIYPLNNSSAYPRTIQGAYDPNFKECNAPGLDDQTGDILLSDTLLAYTIHFQNTGTDTAFNILIEDTLSMYLDPVTVVPGSSSHPYVYEMQNGLMRFHFFNILLPDSNVNEPASHGFVHYTVQRIAGLPVGTTIYNNAYIYFDTNPAIITNTTVNTISNPGGIAPQAEASGIGTYPNPFSESTQIVFGNFAKGKPVTIELYDISGRCVFRKEKAEGNSYTLGRNALPSGVYECRIINASGSAARTKIMIH